VPRAATIALAAHYCAMNARAFTGFAAACADRYFPSAVGLVLAFEFPFFSSLLFLAGSLF